MELKTTMGTAFDVTIKNYFYRERDKQSFILYHVSGPGVDKDILTNGIVLWQTKLEEKLQQLVPDHARCDLNRIVKNLRKQYPHSVIVKYFDALPVQ